MCCKEWAEVQGGDTCSASNKIGCRAIANDGVSHTRYESALAEIPACVRAAARCKDAGHLSSVRIRKLVRLLKLAGRLANCEQELISRSCKLLNLPKLSGKLESW